jgi:uncharacterized membrane protein
VTHSPPPQGNGTGRRKYLDWVRGLAVLIMIEAHVLDSWTRIDVRQSKAYAWAMIVAGFGAPLFLFLAGISVALSAGSKSRRTGDDAAAATTTIKRGAWIFFLALLFRVQSWILGLGSPITLLRVDILNIMGPSIMAAAFLWGAFRERRARWTVLIAAAAAVSLVTPVVRSTAVLDGVPDWLEAYVRPLSGFSSFCFFPWMAFVLAGAAVGVLLDAARTPSLESRLNTRFAVTGLVLTAGAFAASFLPSPYTHSEFWGGSPAFFAMRAGILVVTIAIAYWWDRLPMPPAWSPMEQLGRSSLFIYWIHVELVYGLISLPIHKSFTQLQAWAAYVAFVLAMLLLSIEKDRVMKWWKTRRGPNPYLIASKTF